MRPKTPFVRSDQSAGLLARVLHIVARLFKVLAQALGCVACCERQNDCNGGGETQSADDRAAKVGFGLLMHTGSISPGGAAEREPAVSLYSRRDAASLDERTETDRRAGGQFGVDVAGDLDDQGVVGGRTVPVAFDRGEQVLAPPALGVSLRGTERRDQAQNALDSEHLARFITGLDGPVRVGD